MAKMEQAGEGAEVPEKGRLQELVAVAVWVVVMLTTRLREGVGLAVAVAARRGCFP